MICQSGMRDLVHTVCLVRQHVHDNLSLIPFNLSFSPCLSLSYFLLLVFYYLFFILLFHSLLFLSVYCLFVIGADVINFDGQGVISYRFKVLDLFFVLFFITLNMQIKLFKLFAVILDCLSEILKLTNIDVVWWIMNNNTLVFCSLTFRLIINILV